MTTNHGVACSNHAGCISISLVKKVCSGIVKILGKPFVTLSLTDLYSYFLRPEKQNGLFDALVSILFN